MWHGLCCATCSTVFPCVTCISLMVTLRLSMMSVNLYDLPHVPTFPGCNIQLREPWMQGISTLNKRHDHLLPMAVRRLGLLTRTYTTCGQSHGFNSDLAESGVTFDLKSEFSRPGSASRFHHRASVHTYIHTETRSHTRTQNERERERDRWRE